MMKKSLMKTFIILINNINLNNKNFKMNINNTSI